MGYNTVDLGNRILKARQRINLKQEDVSTRLGVSQSTYSRIETGAADITLTQLYEISSVLEVSVPWLLGETVIELSDSKRTEFEKHKRYIIDFLESL